MSVTGQLRSYGECVFSPGDWVETRCIQRTARRIERDWVQAEHLADQADRLAALNAQGFDIYAGANPRIALGSTTDAGVDLCRTVFVDFDHLSDEPGASYDDIACARIAAAGLPLPTLRIFTGHGVHAYWRLASPIRPGEWSTAQNRLIVTLDSDPAIKNPERIMRLPGFANVKDPDHPVDCFVLDADPSRIVDLPDLLAHCRTEALAVPVTRVDSLSPAQRPAATTDMETRATAYAAAWPNCAAGDRNKTAYLHACQLINDLSVPEGFALDLLRAWNTNNQPPLPDAELISVVHSAKVHHKFTPGAKLERNHAPIQNDAGGGIVPEGKSRKIELVNAAVWLENEPLAPDQIMADTFDRGDKVAIIGSSKLRKSFFLLQGALSIASGREFLHWSVPKTRRVVILQLEIQQSHFHRRVRRMAAAMNITPADIEDRLLILNGRGLGLAGPAGISEIAEIVAPFEPDIVAFDPLYKVASGAENAAEDLKLILDAFDHLAEQTGAAVVFVHHDAKGSSGDRDIRDRGAGSNVLSRSYDACLTLTPHVSEPDAAVVEVLLRNYRPQEPFTVAWCEDPTTGGYRFETRPDLVATKQTSANGRTRQTSFEDCLPSVASIFSEGPLSMTEFKDRLRLKTGLSRDRADRFVPWALLRQEADLNVYEVRRKGTHVKMVGTNAQIERVRTES